MRLPDAAFWRGKRVLLTGHTGFKGAWAALWLSRMGARVHGLSLVPDTSPNLFTLACVERDCISVIADIGDRVAVNAAIADAAPEIVFHMAAQALVTRAIADPRECFQTNVSGTANILAALSEAAPVETIVVVTSDKVYANDGGGRAFREDDPLGGHDPYSASKAATEMVAASFRETYFARVGTRLATARAGNVIGGGDFSADRIVPDCVRAVLSGTPLVLRNPAATRPWQHVLDCLCGYFLYAEDLHAKKPLPHSLNFGPADGTPIPVYTLAEAILSDLKKSPGIVQNPDLHSIEAPRLAVNSMAARETLGWCQKYEGAALVAETANWYRRYFEGADMRTVCLAGLDRYGEFAVR